MPQQTGTRERRRSGRIGGPLQEVGQVANLPATARNSLGAAAMALLLLAAAGCAYRQPRPTGYLKIRDYGQLQKQSTALGIYADRRLNAPVRSPGRRPKPTPPPVNHVVQVLPARWEAAAMDPEIEQEILNLLNIKFGSLLLRYAPPTLLVTRNRDVDAYLKAGANVLQVRLAITDVEKGFGPLRLLAGFTLGAVQLQLEGEVVDPRTGVVLANFARRGASDATVYGLPAPQTLSSRWAWRRAVNESARALAVYLALQLKPPPAGWMDALRLTPLVPEAHRRAVDPKFERPRILTY